MVWKRQNVSINKSKFFKPLLKTACENERSDYLSIYYLRQKIQPDYRT